MKALGELLRADLQARDSRRGRVRTLRRDWPRLAGPALAAHSWARFDQGTVVIVCDDAAWADEVMGLADELRPRLVAALGTPVELRVETEVRPPRKSTPEAVGEAELPAPNPTAAIVAAASGIADLDLRAQVVATAARYLAARKRRM